MKRFAMRKAYLAFAAMLLMAAAPAAAALTPEELFEKVSPSVFMILPADRQGKSVGIGSGVVIGREQVITNCHVLRGASQVLVSRGNVLYGAELEFPDPDRDLCQLKVRELTAPAVPLGDMAKVKTGQRVYAIGAPRGFELTLTEGLISSLRGGDDDRQPIIQTSAAISPGSSGGGLFDADGRLVGITTFQWRGQQLNFALPVDWVREVPQRGRELLARQKELEAARTAGFKAGASGVVLPPIDPSLPKAMPQAGDTWTYVVRDMMFRPEDRSRKFVHTVRTSAPSAIVEVVTAKGAEIAQDAYSPDFNAVYRGGAGLLEFAPFAAAFHSLRPGERFGAIKVRGLEGHAAWASGDVPYGIDNAHVVGPEQVTVAADTFDSLRVELSGRVSNMALGGSAIVRGYAIFKQTVWYAPQVKRVVKSFAEGPGFATLYELESYSLR